MTHTHIQEFFPGVEFLKDNVVCHGGRLGGGGGSMRISEQINF